MIPAIPSVDDGHRARSDDLSRRQGVAAMAVSCSTGSARPMRSPFSYPECSVQSPEYNPEKFAISLGWFTLVFTELVYILGAFPLLVMTCQHEGFAKTNVERRF